MDIYGHFFSPPANQVRLTVSALGVDATYHHVDLMAGEQKTPEYLAINPYGKVPAMVDGDFCLAESNAISRYLGDKVGGHCYPADARSRATIDQWMEFSAHHIRTNTAKLLFNRMLAPMMGRPVDEKSLGEGMEYLNQYLPLVDEQLGKTPFIAGEHMTLADLALVAAMEPFEKVEFDLASCPKLSAWRNGIMEQDFYRSVHSHYAAEMEE